MGRTLRLAMAFGMIGCFWQGICQPGTSDLSQRNSPDPASFEPFFREVAQLKNLSGPVLLNGQPSKLPPPTAQNAIGLTDEESQILNAVASDCEAKIHLFDGSVRSLIFEARLQLIEADNAALPIQQLQDLHRERNRILLTHIQQLRTAFGDSRFKMLDAYVRSRKPGDSFFPLGTARN